MSRLPLLTALLIAAPAVVEGQQPASGAAPRTASAASSSGSVAPSTTTSQKGLSLPRLVSWTERRAAFSGGDSHAAEPRPAAAKSAHVDDRKPAGSSAKAANPKAAHSKSANSKAKKSSNEPMALVDRRLRLFVAQQEAWYAEHARYGSNVSGVARKDVVNDAGMDKVDVQVLYASTKSWTAVATHPDAPGKSCVVFVGNREGIPLVPRTRADANVATDEGRPVCDGKR